MSESEPEALPETEGNEFSLTIRIDLLSDLLTMDGHNMGDLSPAESLKVLGILSVDHQSGLMDLLVRLRQETMH